MLFSNLKSSNLFFVNNLPDLESLISREEWKKMCPFLLPSSRTVARTFIGVLRKGVLRERIRLNQRMTFSSFFFYPAFSFHPCPPPLYSIVDPLWRGRQPINSLCHIHTLCLANWFHFDEVTCSSSSLRPSAHLRIFSLSFEGAGVGYGCMRVSVCLVLFGNRHFARLQKKWLVLDSIIHLAE